MTREEAIDILAESKRQNEVMRDNPSTFWVSHQIADGVKNAGRRIAALNLALSALRPVSREQVEKVWRGNWDVSYDEQNGFTYVTCSKCGDETVLNGCFVTTEGEPCGLEDFCSVCGAPMTDEAVEMVMERLEALEGGKDV